MADLISREAAKEEILSWAVRITSPNNLSTADTMYVLDALPAVDAVEVVRCKDCERMSEKYGEYVCSHALPTKSLTQYFVMGTDILAIVQPDDFCSRGKRREENAGKTV